MIKLNVLIRFSALLITVFFYAQNTYANDVMIGEKGQGVYPLESKAIKLVKEKVVITLRDSKIASREANVRCAFMLQNTTKEKIAVKVGFPTSYYDRDMNYHELKDFVALIDGKSAEINIKEEVDIKQYKRKWYYWDVEFEPESTVEIVNTYEAFLSSDQYLNHFEYVLETGSFWKGDINEATVEIIYPSIEEVNILPVYIRPQGYIIKVNKVLWEFKDFIPSENIELIEINKSKLEIIKSSIIGRLLEKKKYSGDSRTYNESDMEIIDNSQMGKDIEYLKSGNSFISEIGILLSTDPMLSDLKEGYTFNDQEFRKIIKRLYVSALRNEIFARNGRRFETWIFNDIFSNTAWYKPDPNYSDDMLNDMERRNIQFILDYEKEMGWR